MFNFPLDDWVVLNTFHTNKSEIFFLVFHTLMCILIRIYYIHKWHSTYSKQCITVFSNSNHWYKLASMPAYFKMIAFAVAVLKVDSPKICNALTMSIQQDKPGHVGTCNV